MSYWTPWDELMQLQHRLDRLFDHPDIQEKESRNTDTSNRQAGEPTESSGNQPLMRTWRPLCDVKETPPAVTIHCELPGVRKEAVNLEAHDGVLTISRERNYEKKE